MAASALGGIPADRAFAIRMTPLIAQSNSAGTGTMHFEAGQTVGIDLGTTFSTLAQLDQNGNPVAIPNEDDDVETASLILLTERGHVIVGPNRARAAMEDPENVVERIKRHMGDVEYKRLFDGRPITPEFLSGADPQEAPAGRGEADRHRSATR